MSLLERIKASNAWDPRYGLPLLPPNDNPWIYSAYLDILLRLQGEQIDRVSITDHFHQCTLAVSPHRQEYGLFRRWPHSGPQNQTSFDEIMGAAYYDPVIAKKILTYLDKNGGEFNPNGEPETKPLQWNVYRFPFLRPYLLACAGNKLGPFEQIAWAGHMIRSAFVDRGEEVGGRERSWLMAVKMYGRHPICDLAIAFWRFMMRKKSLKASLAIEPKECQILSEIAPDEWAIPNTTTPTLLL